VSPAHGSHGEISAVGRITSVLNAFRDDRDALTLSELARRAALPKSTTHRLTSELIRCGLLEVAEGELRLGLKLFELGQLVRQQRCIRDAAQPVMADLREATRYSVNLGILEGTDIVYVDILAGPDSPRLPTRVGGRWPAHATAIGKAILAFSDAKAVQAVLDAGLSRVSERTITSPRLFRQELVRVRESGLGYDFEGTQPGLVCVASPVCASGGAVPAALSVTGWSARLRVDQAGPAVRTAALAISRALGAQNDGAGARPRGPIRVNPVAVKPRPAGLTKSQSRPDVIGAESSHQRGRPP
jgi:IclR family transcriptional regulator, acetate operon repressor